MRRLIWQVHERLHPHSLPLPRAPPWPHDTNEISLSLDWILHRSFLHSFLRLAISFNSIQFICQCLNSHLNSHTILLHRASWSLEEEEPRNSKCQYTCKPNARAPTPTTNNPSSSSIMNHPYNTRLLLLLLLRPSHPKKRGHRHHIASHKHSLLQLMPHAGKGTKPHRVASIAYLSTTQTSCRGPRSFAQNTTPTPTFASAVYMHATTRLPASASQRHDSPINHTRHEPHGVGRQQWLPLPFCQDGIPFHMTWNWDLLLTASQGSAQGPNHMQKLEPKGESKQACMLCCCNEQCSKPAIVAEATRRRAKVEGHVYSC